MKNNLVITVLVAVVVGGAAFIGGMKVQQLRETTRGRFANMGFSQNDEPRGMMGNYTQGQAGGQAAGGQNVGGPGGQMRGGVRPVMGEIISQDDKSVTVKMADGSTRIVFVSDSTTINKAAQGTKSDLKTGETISAFGTQNADGSVTAENVQLNPVFKMMVGSPAPSTAPNTK